MSRDEKVRRPEEHLAGLPSVGSSERGLEASRSFAVRRTPERFEQLRHGQRSVHRRALVRFGHQPHDDGRGRPCRCSTTKQDRLCKGETQYFELRAETRDSSLRASFGGRARVSAGLHRSTRPHMRLEYGVSGLAWREVGHQRTLLARNPKDPAMLATRTLIQRSLTAFRDGGDFPADGRAGV